MKLLFTRYEVVQMSICIELRAQRQQTGDKFRVTKKILIADNNGCQCFEVADSLVNAMQCLAGVKVEKRRKDVGQITDASPAPQALKRHIMDHPPLSVDISNSVKKRKKRVQFSAKERVNLIDSMSFFIDASNRFQLAMTYYGCVFEENNRNNVNLKVSGLYELIY